MARLNRSLKLGSAPIGVYANIHPGRAIEVVPARDIAEYIASLAKVPDGERVAIHVLAMQFFGDRHDRRAHAPEIVQAGRVLLQALDFSRRGHQEDYQLREVVEVCVAGEDGYDIARAICDNLRKAAEDHRTYGFDHSELLKALFKTQPRAALDALLAGDHNSIAAGTRLIDQAAHMQTNPMDELNERVLFEWCSDDPVHRYTTIASVGSALSFSADHNPVDWTPLASRLVHSAPDPIAVMQALVERFRPMSWSGSRSTILEANAGLLDRFDVQDNAALARFIAVQKESLEKEAGEYLEWETKLDKERDERFE